MFKHFLVPTDLTERDAKAIEIAVEMARQNEGKITFIHVVETLEDAESEDFKKFYKQLGNRAGKKMDAIMDQFRRTGIPLGKKILYGRRVYEILNFAAHAEVDLIIMSSHRLEADDVSEGWGTISFKVGVLSHCPVMLVK